MIKNVWIDEAIRWAEYVWNEELPFVIPRLRLYNREDLKRMEEIGKFITGQRSHG